MNLLKRSTCLAGIICFTLVNIQCKNDKKDKTEDSEIMENKENLVIQKKDFGATSEGEKVDLYILRNAQGMEVEIITYGGRITSIKAPDKNGKYEDVVLGFDSIGQYVSDNPFFGALIGRYGNRIAKGEFSLDGKKFSLPLNDGENHLHGGEKGFDKVVWKVEEVPENKNSLKLSYLSQDMEQGYPGNLNTVVTYTLNDNNSLDVLYEATTDKKTILNLTQHSYFNLSGDFSSTILDHEVKINADKYLPVDATLIPTGEQKNVEGTPFDFREAKTIGRDIVKENEDEQLKRGLGFDHCWVLNEQNSGVRFAASAYHPESGRLLEVFTDEPGIQFYTGNFLDGTLTQKGGVGTYGKRSGFCLETQHFPDSPNQDDFPSVVLAPGEKYTSKTSFKFSIK
jgi:aldose 1-epimerase